jgi:hypothetical protein
LRNLFGVTDDYFGVTGDGGDRRVQSGNMVVAQFEPPSRKRRIISPMNA